MVAKIIVSNNSAVLNVGLYNEAISRPIKRDEIARFFVNTNGIHARAVVVCCKWIVIGGFIFRAAFDFKLITNSVGIDIIEAIGLTIKARFRIIASVIAVSR